MNFENASSVILEPQLNYFCKKPLMKVSKQKLGTYDYLTTSLKNWFIAWKIRGGIPEKQNRDYSHWSLYFNYKLSYSIKSNLFAFTVLSPQQKILDDEITFFQKNKTDDREKFPIVSLILIPAARKETFF